MKPFFSASTLAGFLLTAGTLSFLSVPADLAAQEAKSISAVDLGKEDDSLLTRARKEVDKKDYERAKRLLERSLEDAEDDPAEVLRLLAYCQLQSGDLDDALLTYRDAIKQRRRFAEARTELGLVHLAAVRREIETLETYGASGKKAKDDLIKAIRALSTEYDY